MSTTHFDCHVPSAMTAPFLPARHRTSAGFTLVELMIVVAIIGILAAIALPSYNRYVRESRRIDGQSALHQLALAQEKYRSTNATYASSVTALGIGNQSPDGHYTLSVSTATATGFSATATAKTPSQQADTGCTSLTLTVSSGVMTTGPAGCWRK